MGKTGANLVIDNEGREIRYAKQIESLKDLRCAGELHGDYISAQGWVQWSTMAAASR